MAKMKKGPKANFPNKSPVKSEKIKVEQPKMKAYKRMADKIAAMKASGLGKLKGIK